MVFKDTEMEAPGAVAELHDRRPSWVRDLPAGGRPVTVVWVKRVWRWAHALCPKRTWTETSSVIAGRVSRRVGSGRVADQGQGSRSFSRRVFHMDSCPDPL